MRSYPSVGGRSGQNGDWLMIPHGGGQGRSGVIRADDQNGRVAHGGGDHHGRGHHRRSGRLIVALVFLCVTQTFQLNFKCQVPPGGLYVLPYFFCRWCLDCPQHRQRTMAVMVSTRMKMPEATPTMIGTYPSGIRKRPMIHHLSKGGAMAGMSSFFKKKKKKTKQNGNISIKIPQFFKCRKILDGMMTEHAGIPVKFPASTKKKL